MAKTTKKRGSNPMNNKTPIIRLLRLLKVQGSGEMSNFLEDLKAIANIKLFPGREPP